MNDQANGKYKSLHASWEQHSNSRWSVAQLKAPIDSVIKVLLSKFPSQLRCFMRARSNGSFPYDDEWISPMVMFEMFSSRWTYVESFNSHLDPEVFKTVSQELGIHVVMSAFEDNCGAGSYTHYSSGVVEEEFWSTHPEFDKFTRDEYLQKNWIVSESGFDKYFSRNGRKVDAESLELLPLWDLLASRLMVSVPPPLWWIDKECKCFEVEEESPFKNTILHATLFDM